MTSKKTVRYNGKNYRVPVDENGLVPGDYLMAIQERRSPRSKNMDSRRRAKSTFPQRPEPMQVVMWTLHPGRFDIEGIDTPVVIEEKTLPVEIVPPQGTERPTKAEPAPKGRKGRVRGKGYASSTWDRKLDFDNDPEGSLREMHRLQRAEDYEATEDMRAYLDDNRYDEYGKKRYTYDDRDLVNDYYDKMWDDYRTYEEPTYFSSYNRRSRR